MISDILPGWFETYLGCRQRMYDYLLGGKDNYAADRAGKSHLWCAVGCKR